ncbi:hypothetical protein, partial [Sinorhizobium meliloti]|uniref:hypothetical protein n=1 Tax=Rhizobium meliloti TaxID=382 RepID=UPI001AEC87C5
MRRRQIFAAAFAGALAYPDFKRLLQQLKWRNSLHPRVCRDCQEFCAVGHDDEKERIITWLSRKNFWTSFW